MQHQTLNEFNIRELLSFLKKKLWIVVVLTMVGGIGGYIWGKTQVGPTYIAESQIYVLREDKQVDYSSLQTATQLRRDCEVLLAGRNVTEKVIERLGLTTTHEALSAGLTVSSVENTRILKVSYEASDPNQAALILNSFCQVGAEEIKNIMAVDVVQVLYEADPPRYPSSQGAKSLAMTAALGGLILALTVLIIYFVMDDTIRNEEDVERYLELPTLASIPISSELGDTPRSKATKKSISNLAGKRKR